MRCIVLILAGGLLAGCAQTPDVQRLSTQGAADPAAPTTPIAAPSSTLGRADVLAAPTTIPSPQSPEESR